MVGTLGCYMCVYAVWGSREGQAVGGCSVLLREQSVSCLLLLSLCFSQWRLCGVVCIMGWCVVRGGCFRSLIVGRRPIGCCLVDCVCVYVLCCWSVWAKGVIHARLGCVKHLTAHPLSVYGSLICFCCCVSRSPGSSAHVCPVSVTAFGNCRGAPGAVRVRHGAVLVHVCAEICHLRRG